MKPDELHHWKLFAAFEGGAVHTAERDGRFYVILDEGALRDLIDDDDMADHELTKAIEFNSLQARKEYLNNRVKR